MRFENEFDFSPWSIAVQLDTSEANATFSVIELEKSTGGGKSDKHPLSSASVTIIAFRILSIIISKSLFP